MKTLLSGCCLIRIKKLILLFQGLGVFWDSFCKILETTKVKEDIDLKRANSIDLFHLWEGDLRKFVRLIQLKWPFVNLGIETSALELELELDLELELI